jgi:hypothetical protein
MSVWHRLMLLSIGLLAGLVLWPNVAVGQAPPRVELDAGDGPIVVRGVLGDDSTFVANLRLTARDGDVRGLTMVATDLKNEEAAAVLERQNVSLVGDANLTKDVPRDFQLKVANVRVPGQYTGRIRLLVPTPGPETPLDITVDARDPQIEPLVNAEYPLEIRGWIGDENGFTGNLRLTARGGSVRGITIESSQLQHADQDEALGPGAVTLVGDTTLTADVPKDLQVRVSGIKVPGVYTGTVRIKLPVLSRTEPQAIRLKVDAEARPQLTAVPGTDRVRLRLVNCGMLLDCFLARAFLRGADQDDVTLRFENRLLAPVTFISAQPSVQEENTGAQLNASALVVKLPPTPTPTSARLVELSTSLDRSAMPPGHYVGAIYLTHTARDGTLTVPIDISVRSGPFWPLVALFFGILGGRLVKYYQEKGGKQVDAMLAVRRAQNDLDSAHVDDQAILRPMVEAVRQNVNRGNLDKVAEELAAIKGRQETLAKLRALETRLLPKRQHPSAAALLTRIAEAREQVKAKNDADVTTRIKNIEQGVAGLVTANVMGTTDSPENRELVEEARSAVSAASQAETLAQRTETPPPGKLDGFKRALVRLSGLSDDIRAEATLWLLRPMLWLVLLIGLLLIGMSSLYVTNGATFGANPLADYLGLLLWGLSADVASRTLGNLNAPIKT